MNGFLAGLVQRGATVPTIAAESPGFAAPAARGGSVYALEAPPELVDAAPAPPTAMPREESGRTGQMSPAQPDAVAASPLQSAVHITQVHAGSPPAPSEAVQVAAEPAEPPQPLRVMPPVLRAESVRAPEQSSSPIPQPPQQIERPHTRLPETSVSLTARRPAATLPPPDVPRASNEQRMELEVMHVFAPRTAPVGVGQSAAPAPEVREVPLTAAPIATREFPRIEAPAPSRTPPAPPPIHVRIGRVEVKPATPSPAPAPPKTADATPALGFAAYRRLRTYRM